MTCIESTPLISLIVTQHRRRIHLREPHGLKVTNVKPDLSSPQNIKPDAWIYSKTNGFNATPTTNRPFFLFPVTRMKPSNHNLPIHYSSCATTHPLPKRLDLSEQPLINPSSTPKKTLYRRFQCKFLFYVIKCLHNTALIHQPQDKS